MSWPGENSFYTKISLLVIGIAAGLFIAAQAKTAPTRVTNPVSPFIALREARKELLNQEDALNKESTALSEEIRQLQNAITRNTSLSQDAVTFVEELRRRTGLEKLESDGIEITLSDSPSRIATPNSIAHASDIRDIAELAWSTGASAIAVNGERIVFTSSIDSVINTVMINNVKTVPPFTITILGPTKPLFEAFNNATLLPNLFQRVRDENLVFQVAVKRRLVAPAYTGSFTVRFGKVEL